MLNKWCHGAFLQKLLLYKVLCLANVADVAMSLGVKDPRGVKDTRGKEFVFVTPFCNETAPPMLYVIPQSGVVANVSITSNATKLSNIHLSSFYFDKVTCIPPKWNDISPSGLQISSSNEVTAFIEYENDNYQIFPVDTLGREYMVTVVTTVGSYLIITASEHQTRLSVTIPSSSRISFKFKTNWYFQSDILMLNIDKFQTIAIKCVCDLTGLMIIGSKPVYILVGSFHPSDENAQTTMEQIPPANTWGREFLIPFHRATLPYVSLSLIALMWPCKYTLTSGVKSSKPYFMSKRNFAKIQTQATDFLHLKSNCSVLPAVQLESFDLFNNKSYISLMFGVPSELYISDAVFNMDFPQFYELSLIIPVGGKSSISINGKLLSLSEIKEMTTVDESFALFNGLPFQSSSNVFSFDENSKQTPTFSGYAFKRTEDTFQAYSLGSRLIDIHEACVPLVQKLNAHGDGFDNDCDGKIDEEVYNGLDDDKDNLIDEDTRMSKNEDDMEHLQFSYLTQNAIRESARSAFLISLTISACVGFFAILGFIGGMLLADKVKNNLRQQPKIFPTVNNSCNG